MSDTSDYETIPQGGVAGQPPVFRHVLDVARHIYHSVWPNEENRWLVAAQLKVVRKTTRYAAFTMPFAGFAVAEACAPWVPFAWRIGWMLAVALVAVIFEAAEYYVEARWQDDLAQVRLKACFYTVSTLVLDSVWSAMTVCLWAKSVPVDHLLLALVLATSLSAATTVGHTHLGTALSVLVSHALFLTLPFALSPATLDHLLACLALAYIAFMVAQTVVFHATQRRALLLEHERIELVDDLRWAKLESDRERARAVAAGRTKSKFLSNMNHELRTPMNAILGFSELIAQKAFGAAVDKYAEYADIIHQSGLTLLRLIDDMLDLAKIEGGKLSLRESEVNVAGLVAELGSELMPQAEAAQVSLTTRITPGLPKVLADERALRQIMNNLASNALKFTPRGGAVTLFAGRERDGRIAIGVEDTGIGIAEEDQIQAFDRFGSGRHDISKGTGLGLAIVKGFAEAHDGTVALASTLGVGTCVTAYLPADRVLGEGLRRAG